jgi:hypothetical protein
MATKKLKKKSRSKKRDALPDAEKPVVIRTHALTPADVEILERLTQDTRDYTGQTISSSAIVRALLRFADAQGYQESTKKSGRRTIPDLLNARQIAIFRSRVVFASPTL